MPRPVKMAKRNVDAQGFQYLMKEGKMPLYQRGFTVDDLKKLVEKSEAHVEELKEGLKEHLHKRKYESEPSTAFDHMRDDALEYYEAEQKRPRPAFQKDVLWAMYLHPDRSDAWKRFVSQRI
jgi:hypothetical protein